MIDTSQLETDMAAMIADMPINVIFGGRTLSGNKTVIASTEVAAAAGALEGYKFSVNVVASGWAVAPSVTPPGVGDLMNAAGADYRVLRLNSDVVGVRYDLGEKYTEATK